MLRTTTLAGTILIAAALALSGCAGVVAAGGGSASASASASAKGSSSESAVGEWGDVDDSTQPSLVLAKDGTLTGTDGCNQLNGGWTQEGDTVTFSNVASTMMMCADVDTWLAGLDTAKVDGSTMTVYGPAGRKVGTLERADG